MADGSVYSVAYENATAEIAFLEGSGRVRALYNHATGLYYKGLVTCKDPCTTRDSWLEVVYEVNGNTATDMRGGEAMI